MNLALAMKLRLCRPIGLPIGFFRMPKVRRKIVQMPPGIPVATVAINGAKNAGLLALKILALNDSALNKKLEKMSSKMNSEVKSKAKKLEEQGFERYQASIRHIG